ncbi:MAG: iron-only hydrogenase system regulator [Clostridiales bacterium]|nr:iron-only hydrogenase system regulator [Clostridiales bacterium]
METRVAVITIIVSNGDSVETINGLLHEAAPFIIGRMGIPYHAKNINIITIAIDAPQDITSEVSGRIGRLEGVTVKTTYSNVIG